VNVKVKQRLTLYAGVCSRRQWPSPVYHVSPSRAGYTCVVRVNNREYQTQNQYQSVLLAKEAAATTAYSIVANFSANDGMYPQGFASGGVIQGNPVPVGSGRHARRSESTYGSSYQSNASGTYSRDESNSPGSRSGQSSPETPTWALPAAETRVNRHQATGGPPRHHQEPLPLRRHQEPPRNRHRY